jgi:hypothetical protein
MNPDTEFDPMVDPYYIGKDDDARGLNSFRTDTAVQVNQGLDANPDDAAEATDLSNITGAPAPWTLNNLDEQKAQIKKFAAQQLVLNNPDLVTYLQSHPMAASVSNDDWGNLDKFTRESHTLTDLLHGLVQGSTGIAVEAERIKEAGVQGWGEAYTPEQRLEGQQKYGRLGGAVLAALTQVAAVPGQEFGGYASMLAQAATDIPGFKEFATWAAGKQQDPALAQASLLDTTNAVLVALGMHIPAEVGKLIGGSEAPPPIPPRKAFSDPQVQEYATRISQGKASTVERAQTEAGAAERGNTALRAGLGLPDVATSAKPWTDAGVPVPSGVHPLIDEAKTQINMLAVANMERDFENMQKAATRERSPELAGVLAEQRYGDNTIGIRADAALGLYGDKPPMPDDGLLGWVPNIESQLMGARDTDSDIQVPIKDWITKADPQVAKGLHDDIRMWPGGITAREAEEEPTQPKAVVDAPLAAVRGASGLEPMFSIGDRKISLIKGATEANQFTDEFGGKLETLNMMDENGKHVGDIEIAPGADRTLYINMINGVAGRWANSFGPALMRDLKRQIKGMYPDYDYITGHRVSGAREASGADDFGPMPLPRVKLDADDITAQDFQRSRDVLENGWSRYQNSSLLKRDPEAVQWTQKQVDFSNAAMDELQRITGKKIEIEPTAGLYSQRAKSFAGGAYVPFKGAPPTILLDMLRDDAVGTGRHEAIHFLRGYGFFKDAEWSTLESAAKAENWADRYGINDRYAHVTDEQRTEESVAEAFREWAKQAPEVRPKTGVGAVFQKIMDLLDGIKSKLGFGPEETWESVFQKIHSGEVGERPAGEPRAVGAFDIRESIEGFDNIKAESLGIDKDTFRRIQAAMEKQHEADIEVAQKRAVAEQTKRQGAEWKANRAEMAKTVAVDIRQRPDVAADLFLGNGELFGKKLRQRYTLAADELTPEQKAALPKEYVSKNGLPPDQVASMFGYSTGAEMVDRLATLEQAKRTPEGTRMPTGEFLRQTIQSETDRRMEREHGFLEKNIMEDARDQALSEASFNVMHEQLMAAAMKAGTTAFDKDTIKQAARDLINEQTIGKVNTYALMQTMGKHSRDAEKAMAAQDFKSAAVAMQKQTVTMAVAQEARKVEKEVAKFDKTAKKLAARVQPGIEPEYTNWIHSILAQVGKKVKRTPGDLQRETEAAGSGNTLPEFVANKAVWLREIPVWDQLYNANFKAEYKDLKVPEFRAVAGSIDALVHNGRDERKIIKQGVEADWQEIKPKLVEAVARFKGNAQTETGGTMISKFPRAFLASTLQMENVFGRWDKFDPYGNWTQYVFRDLHDGVNQSDAWKKEFARKLKDAGDKEDMKQAIPNSIFRRPKEYGDTLITMNRENLRAVMLNVGNKSNMMKLAKGYGLEPDAIMAWVHANAKKPDWDFAQKIWDTFDEMKGRSDTMYRSISGVPAESIPARAAETPFGTYRGGYYPAMRHPIWGGEPAKFTKLEGLMGEGFEAGYTPAGYTKSRTGVTYPLALDLNQMPNRLSQMIHDTALRPAVLNAAKVLRDKAVRGAITTHYGKEYSDNMVPWLRGIANASNNVSKESAWLQSSSDFVRQNLITTLVGWNPGTVLKHAPTAAMLSMHEVGAGRFFDAVKSLFSINDETGEKNWDFAIKNSLELQRRDRNWQETLYGATNELQAGSKFGTWRAKIMQLSSKPVAMSDIISAVPTWMAQYGKAMEEGATHGDAVFEADRAVRRAHGSTAASNRPAITNVAGGWLTSVYNFFNDIMNRQMETLWKAGEAVDLAKEGQHGAAMAAIPAVAGGMFAYAIWPAIVEQMVSPLPSEPQDSWAHKAAKGLAYTASASWPGIRDVVNGMLEGKDPDIGLATTFAKEFTDAVRDLNKKDWFSPQHAEKMIRDAGGLVGVLTGIPQQLAKELSAAYGVATGHERPRGPWGWLVLGRYGTLKGHSQTGADYLAGRYDRSK